MLCPGDMANDMAEDTAKNSFLSTEGLDERPGWLKAPLLRVLASQIIGAAIAFAGAGLVTQITNIPFPVIVALLFQGIIAGAIGFFMRLPNWWLPVQIGLPPVTGWALLIAIPGWVYLTLFIVLVLIYWNSATNRVPLYLTNRKTVDAVAQLLPIREGPKVLDLGCGTGSVVFPLALERPDAKIIGIESAPLVFLGAWIRLHLSGVSNVGLILDDFWKRDLGEYDIVYAFLSPIPMGPLYHKAVREMKKGSLFVSNSFLVPGFPPDETILVEDKRKTRLYVWQMRGQMNTQQANAQEADSAGETDAVTDSAPQPAAETPPE